MPQSLDKGGAAALDSRCGAWRDHCQLAHLAHPVNTRNAAGTQDTLFLLWSGTTAATMEHGCRTASLSPRCCSDAVLRHQTSLQPMYRIWRSCNLSKPSADSTRETYVKTTQPNCHSYLLDAVRQHSPRHLYTREVSFA